MNNMIVIKSKYEIMKYKSKLLIVTSLLFAFLIGCKNDSNPELADTTPPTITITTPTAGQSFAPGSTILFQASFSDNKLLKSYEIEVSKVVTGGLALKNVPTSVPFSYTKSSTNFSSGDSPQTINLTDIVIPANTATTITTPGNYNFKVSCVDGSNNPASQTVVISIE
jgi:hypothetical protein